MKSSRSLNLNKNYFYDISLPVLVTLPNLKEMFILLRCRANQIQLHHKTKIITNCSMFYYLIIKNSEHMHCFIIEVASCWRDAKKITYMLAINIYKSNNSL